MLGPIVHSIVVPAGPVAAHDVHTAGAGTSLAGCTATLRWQSTAGPTMLLFRVGAELWSNTTAGGQSAGVGPAEFLVELATPTPCVVNLHLARNIAIAAGSLVPEVRVDIGNDGTVEFSEARPVAETQVQLTLGPVPLSVRCVVAAASTGGAVGSAELTINALPVEPAVHTLLSGCSPSTYHVLPTFTGDVQVAHYPAQFELAVGVFGLGVQPLLLGTSTFPCVLLPSPDLLLFLPPYANESLTIPASALPITLWTQAVALAPQGLLTTAGYQVTAQ